MKKQCSVCQRIFMLKNIFSVYVLVFIIKMCVRAAVWEGVALTLKETLACHKEGREGNFCHILAHEILICLSPNILLAQGCSMGKKLMK